MAGYNFVKLALPVLVLHAAVAVAQTRPDAGTLLQDTRPGTAPGPRGAVPLTQPAPSQFKGDNAKVKIKVTAFRFSGNTVFDERQLAAVVAGELNKELDFDGLEKAVEAVKQYYLSKGYFLAVPYLPQQDWAGGVVRIHVLEGRLGRAQVNTKPGSRISSSVGERYMSTIKPGVVATESDVFRQLLLLQDLPGVAVAATMGPGQNVGEGDMTVEVEDRGGRFTGGLEFDNYGNKFSGTHRLAGAMSANNLIGQGDLLSLRGLVAENNLTQVGTVAYVLPVGPWGTKVGGSYTELRYRLRGETVLNDVGRAQDLGALKASGTGDITTLLLIHPILRSREMNLFAQLSGDVKNTEDRVLTAVGGGTFNVQQRRVRATRLSGLGDFRDGIFGAERPAFNTFGLTYSYGKALALTTDAIRSDDNAPLTGNDRIGSFSKVNGEYQRTQRLGQQFYGIVRVNGQWASRNLPSIEKFSAGGAQGVRAYPAGEGLADAGALITAEARYNVPALAIAGNEFALTAFVDAARVRRSITQPANDTAATGFSVPIGTVMPNHRTFIGGGLGVRLSGGPRFSISADIAWRIGSERAQSDVNRSPTAWLRGTFEF